MSHEQKHEIIHCASTILIDLIMIPAVIYFICCLYRACVPSSIWRTMILIMSPVVLISTIWFVNVIWFVIYTVCVVCLDKEYSNDIDVTDFDI